MKQRRDLPLDRISLKGQLFLDGEEITSIIKRDKVKYIKIGKFMLNAFDLKRISELMYNEKNKAPRNTKKR